MGYSTFGKRLRRFLQKRGVQERWAEVADPRSPQGRRWTLRQVLETGLGALVRQMPSCHRRAETTRRGPPLRVGELRLAPIPDATLQWMLPQLNVSEVRQMVVNSVRAEVRRTSVRTPEGALRPLAIDGKCLWSGRRGGCEHGQSQGAGRVPRVMRALLTSARPRLLLDQRALEAEENESGALAAFWTQRHAMYGRLGLWEVVTGDAGYCSLKNATLIDPAGYGDVLGLKANQPELWCEAQRLLGTLATRQRPEAQLLERDHGQWVRRSLWRPQACAGWWDWGHLRQVWLVRTEKFTRQTTPRPDRVPGAVADHYDLTHLRWCRLDGGDILGVVRGHWGMEHHGFRTLDMDWQEERAWGTKGAATAGLGWLRRWAYTLVGLLKSRDLRSRHGRELTLGGLIAWLGGVSLWGEARRYRRRVVPTGSSRERADRGLAHQA